MLVIGGRVYVNIKIDQKYLSYAPDVFSNLTLTESIAGLFPAAMLILNDYSGQLNRQLALTEGNEMLVTVGKTPNDLNTVTRQYRLFKTQQAMTAFGPQLRVACVYDAPKYISEGAREHYKGTSSQVLQQIADKCKLYYCGPESFNGKSLDDAQSWWNVNRSRATFAQYNVARHGYMDSHSAMCAALTSLGEIRYRNLIDVIESPMNQIKYLFAHSSPISDEDKRRKVYLVDAAQAHSDAGMMNSWQNYGSTRVVHTLDGNQIVEESVDVKTSGKFLAINDQVSQTIGKARFDHSLLDCGNVNPKYERAFYQNLKQLGLFSERMSILVSEPTAVQLLDPIIYRQSFADLRQTANVSDLYIVIGKTIFIKGGAYYAERLELVRMSLTEKGESDLKCATTPDKAVQSAIPESIVDPTEFSTATKPGLAARQLDVAKAIQAGAKDADQSAQAAKTSSLKVAKAIVNAARSAVNISNMVKGGASSILANPAAAIQTISGATGALLSYNTAVGGFSNDYAQSGVKALAYANAQLNNPVFGEAIRVATLIKPGGFADNQAAISGAIALDRDMNYVFNSGFDTLNTGPVISALNGTPGGSQALNAYNARVAEMNTNTQLLQAGLSDMWNGSLVLATGQSQPSTLYRDNSNSIYSFIDGSLNQPTYEAKVKSPSDVKAELVKTILTPNDDKTYKWATPTQLANYTVTRTADEVVALASNLVDKSNRFQSQQAMSYV